MISNREAEFIRAVLDCVDPASGCGIGNEEIGKVRDIIARESPKPTLGEAVDIDAWIDKRLNGTGGLKAYLRGERPTKAQIARWIIRCLANERCEGSDEVLQAILDERVEIRG